MYLQRSYMYTKNNDQLEKTEKWSIFDRKYFMDLYVLKKNSLYLCTYLGRYKSCAPIKSNLFHFSWRLQAKVVQKLITPFSYLYLFP
jgi:hypothetical protein